MSAQRPLQLPGNLEPTRATLHRYARVIGVVALAHGESHPKWWQISLKVDDSGFRADRINLPDGRYFQLRMDFLSHAVVLDVSDGTSESFDMTCGATGTVFGDELLAAVASLGVSADYKRDEFEGNEPRFYDPGVATGFHAAIAAVAQVFEDIRSELTGERGPVQLWPHGFDIAFEWFGAEQSQINLGFYPEGEAYFYSNPWPFDKTLLSKDLPHGAKWHTDGWEGSRLDLDVVSGNGDWGQKVREFAMTVHSLARLSLSSPL